MTTSRNALGEILSRGDRSGAQPVQTRAVRHDPGRAGFALRRRLVLGSATVPLWLACRGYAADVGRYPERPIRCVIPSPAGGTGDVLVRLVAPHLSEAMGQPLVIDYRPGAAGRIAMEHTAKAAPDGYTLFLANNATTFIAPGDSAAAGLDPRRSFVPVTKLASIPVVIAVSPALGVTTLAALLERARHEPGRLAFASSGIGSTSHLAARLLFRRAGVTLLHVPYPGTAFAVKDVLSGEVPVLFTYPPTVAGHLRSGQLRALAVTGARRVAAFADIPTVAESGYPDFDVTTWYGMLVPIGTPGEIVRRLHDELVRVMALPEVREHFARMGMQPVGNSPAAFAAELDGDYLHWTMLMRDFGKASE